MKNHKQILAGSLIDGAGSPRRKNVLIYIKDSYITDLQYNYTGQADNDITDLSAYTVIPCLTDCHTHLAWTSENNLNNKFSPEYKQALNIIKDNLRKYNAMGVMAVRDGGDKNAYALKYKHENNNNFSVSIRCPGTAIHKRGGYGSIIGRGVGTAEEAAAIINEQNDIDHVKIVTSGLNSLTEFAEQTESQFSCEELSEIVESARKTGLPVMAHANGKIPVRNAILAGCASIEHGFFMGGENLKLMADRQVFWVPTAVAMKAYEEIFPENSTESITAGKNLDHQLEQLSLAKELGTPVALGTDAGSPGVMHGLSVAWELGLFVKAGFTIEQAVQCACRNSVKLLGIAGSGIIAPGMKAEMIAAPGSPDDLAEGLLSEEKIIITE